MPFWKCLIKDNEMMSSAADLVDLQTKQCIFTPTYYTFLKIPDQGQCNGDLCSWFGWPPNQTKPNNAYLPLHDIPFWKRQTKDIAMVTSAADLGDLQTKPNQTK